MSRVIDLAHSYGITFNAWRPGQDFRTFIVVMSLIVISTLAFVLETVEMMSRWYMWVVLDAMSLLPIQRDRCHPKNYWWRKNQRSRDAVKSGQCLLYSSFALRLRIRTYRMWTAWRRNDALACKCVFSSSLAHQSCKSAQSIWSAMPY